MPGNHPHGQKGSHTQLGHTQVPSYLHVPVCNTHKQIHASYIPSLVVSRATGSGHRPFVKPEKGEVPSPRQQIVSVNNLLPQTCQHVTLGALTHCTGRGNSSAWWAGSAAGTGCLLLDSGGRRKALSKEPGESISQT